MASDEMLATAGVDIGSTTSKAVVLVDGLVRSAVISDSSANPTRTAEQVYERALEEAKLDRKNIKYIVGTGYGRTRVAFADGDVSEITCHGRGANFLVPDCRTVIDIGGQDTKAICIDDRGNLLDFAMNDKCAAGTGRFLEAMARSLEVPIADMSKHYFGDGHPCMISSMCSVFAESEVISLINEGVPLPRIVKGLLQSLANRVSAQVQRVGIIERVVMTGGVAKNEGVRQALSSKLRVDVFACNGMDPQVVGALGAAVVAAEYARKGNGGNS